MVILLNIKTRKTKTVARWFLKLNIYVVLFLLFFVVDVLNIVGLRWLSCGSECSESFHIWLVISFHLFIWTYFKRVTQSAKSCFSLGPFSSKLQLEFSLGPFIQTSVRIIFSFWHLAWSKYTQSLEPLFKDTENCLSYDQKVQNGQFPIQWIM